MIALGRELAARGHDVTLQTWNRWQPAAEALGMRFDAAPEYHVFPTLGRALKPYEAVVRATEQMRPALEALAPDAVVADILTLAPALAAERAGVPWATLVPHVFPAGDAGHPPYSLGARLPRTAAGRVLWRALGRWTAGGLERGRQELNGTRARLGLAELERVHGGISDRLCVVATLPELEYPRAWPASVHVVGPLQFELEHPEVELPPGDGPLVLVAPSTAQDPDHALLRNALRGLADLPVRVLATWNRRLPSRALPVPDNAVLVPWVSYARTIPHCDLVITHAGHGTVMRALTSGAPVLAVPAAGDMNENAARVAWAGLGVRLPRRFATPRALRVATAHALADSGLRERVRALRARDGAARAADLVEVLAAGGSVRHAN